MYRLVRFAEINLEQYNQVDDVGSGQTPTHYIILPDGGAIDGFGALQKHPGVIERVKTMRLSVSTETALAQAYFRLLELRGRRERLYRRLPDNSEHWQLARLISVAAKRSYEMAKFKNIQDVELRFVSGEMIWHGNWAGTRWFLNDAKFLNDGLDFNGAPIPLTEGLNNFVEIVGSDDAGRAPVRALKIIVTAGSAIISRVDIARAGGEIITYATDIQPGSSLIIDTGTFQVTLDGADAYNAAFQVTPVADLGSWFCLLPGENQIIVNLVGGSGTFDLDYYEAWY